MGLIQQHKRRGERGIGEEKSWPWMGETGQMRADWTVTCHGYIVKPALVTAENGIASLVQASIAHQVYPPHRGPMNM